MKRNATIFIGPREALPVRAIPLVTAWFVTPEQLALELSKPDSERTFSAYSYSGDQGIPLKAQTWGMRHDALIDIARSYKLPGQDPDQHRQIAWRKLLEELPTGTYVWRDEFERWYASTYYSPESVWDEEHRVIDVDDEPGPVFHQKQREDTLDLSAVALHNFEDLVFEGFDFQMSTASGPTQSATVAVGTASNEPCMPEPQRRLKRLRELGGTAKRMNGRWTFTGIVELVKDEKQRGYKRNDQKSMHQIARHFGPGWVRCN
jgi:hypothetical protein